MRFQRSDRHQRGSTFVILMVFLTALFSFAGLSIDVSNVLYQRKKMHEATDAGALAAVRDWATGKTSAASQQMGQSYCLANGMKSAEVVSVETGTWNASTKTFTPATTLPANSVPAVRVVGRRAVQTFFARVVGMTVMNPRVESIAIVGRATSAVGALPWAVCDSFTPVKCMPITLQFKAGGETNACSSAGPLSGNFGQLTLPGGSGASWYQSNIANGYPGALYVGQWVDTDTGVSAGPTKKGIDDRIGGLPPYNCTATSEPPDNARRAIIPKVHSLDVSGKKAVQIIGFYVISLDGYKNGGKEVQASFLEVFAGTEVDPSAPPVSGELSGLALVR